MADINTPIDASATEVAMGDTVQNPPRVVGNYGTHIVHLDLVLRGVDFSPGDIYTMVNAQYGTVASVKETSARGTYILEVEA
jgi:hypothetical protein